MWRVEGGCSFKPGGWEALMDTTYSLLDLETTSMALSTPRSPLRKVFSQLPGSHNLARYLLSLSGVLSPASLAGRQEEAAVVNTP